MASPELETHVEELARELGVVIIPPWVGSLGDEAVDFPAGAAGVFHLEDGTEAFAAIWVSELPTNAEAYLVALHELGHHAWSSEPVEGMTLFANEHGAWAWAESKSIIPITPRLRAFIERRLDSYRD